MSHKFDTLLNELTPTQRLAVNWNKGSLLLLANTGSGTSEVIACRVSRLLIESGEKRFRVLILASTEKAIHEITGLLHSLVPEFEERTRVLTFHRFCEQVLRQHGGHIQVKPNFQIYSQPKDRYAVLREVLHEDSDLIGLDATQLLPILDQIKSQLISPEQFLCEPDHSFIHYPSHLIGRAYRLYEEKLKQSNALDSNSLILEAYKLFENNVFGEFYQSLYNYWFLDELQDISDSQYRLLKRMTSNGFQDIFTVADDDVNASHQISNVYHDRIRGFASDFSSSMIQLPSSPYCPTKIIEVANRLTSFGVPYFHHQGSNGLLKNDSCLGSDHVRYAEYSTDMDEVSGIVREIFKMNDDQRSRTLILAQSQSLLQLIYDELQRKEINATILVHRDDFVSPKMRWIIACVRQIFRPLDLQNFAKLVHSFNTFSSTDIDADDTVVHATAQSVIYFPLWIDFVQKIKLSENLTGSVAAFKSLQERSITPDVAIHAVIDLMSDESDDPDFQDDILLWKRVYKSLAGPIDFSSIDTLLKKLDHCHQNLSPKDRSVSLATIRSMKGFEYETIYLMGLAEEILPSWSSIQYEHSRLLDEERRACFLAITQTKKRVTLSRADHYHGDQKSPSRFLEEMGFLHEKASGSEEKIYAEALA